MEEFLNVLEFVLGVREEGGVQLFQRPFAVTGALAHLTFLFVMEHRLLRLSTQLKRCSAARACFSIAATATIPNLQPLPLSSVFFVGKCQHTPQPYWGFAVILWTQSSINIKRKTGPPFGFARHWHDEDGEHARSRKWPAVTSAIVVTSRGSAGGIQNVAHEKLLGLQVLTFHEDTLNRL